MKLLERKNTKKLVTKLQKSGTTLLNWEQQKFIWEQNLLVGNKTLKLEAKL